METIYLNLIIFTIWVLIINDVVKTSIPLIETRIPNSLDIYRG